jgi:hypothetical protein
MANARQSKRWQRGISTHFDSRDFVNFSLPAGSSHADEVRAIAEQLSIRVDSLPPELDIVKMSRGSTVFGSASKRLNIITANYKNLYWSISDGVLRLAFIRDVTHYLSDFDTLAGRLMLQARPEPNSRLSQDQWLAIAQELDKRKFAPLDYLEPTQRKVLTDYNKGDHRIHIHSWATAFNLHGRDGAKIARAVKQRLNRACERYRQCQTVR